MVAAESQSRVTMGDIAKRAGVNTSVVSRVVSRDPALRVSEATRRRVLGVIAEMNYKPNMIAKGLRTARTQMIGIVIPDFRNPVYASIIAGAERAAARLDQALLVASAAQTSLSHGEFTTVLDGGWVDALLVAGGEARDAIALLARANIPVLLVNRKVRGAQRHVLIDDQKAATIAVEHLIALGHRRIAHITGPADVEPCTRRHQGYLSALASAGLRAERDLVIRASQTPSGGAAAMKTLLDLKRAPTAVFVDSVAPALGALHMAAQRGRVVPDDLSVVGVHDIDLLSFMDPGLTTVATPLQRLGERAVELVCSTAPSAAISEVIGDPMHLVVRGSTGPVGTPPPGRRPIP